MLSKNCQKLDIFFKKIAKNFAMGNFFLKKCNFLAIFSHSNGNFPEGQIRTPNFSIRRQHTSNEAFQHSKFVVHNPGVMNVESARC